MKRILTLVFAVVLSCFSICSFAGCKKDDRLIRLSEVTHSIFYAPLYVAINKGYFDDLDIRIKISDAGGAQNVMNAIASKSADIGLMGPEATIYCHVEGQENYPVIFGQLTQRDGSFLVGRNAEPDFEWSNLAGKDILAGRPGGVPAMTLQYVIENVGGLSLSQLNFDTKVEFNLMIPTFESDSKYEYCTMFEPNASDFVARGLGHIVASVGEAGGDIPYTAFSASKSFLSQKNELCADFLRAVDMGREFMETATLDEIAAALAPSFFGVDLELIKASIERYLQIEAWCDNFAMSEASFNRLQDVMQNAGRLTSRADYSKAVDNTIANSL